MAVRSSTFEIAAFDAEQKKKGETYVEIGHGGGRFSLWRPVTQGQFGRFTLDINKAQVAMQIPAIDRLLQKVMLSPEEVAELAESGEVDDDGEPYQERIAAGDTPVGPDFLWDAFEAGALRDDDGEESVLPILRMIAAVMKAATGFPTAPSSGSTSTPRASGSRSTATSRRAGSTRSTSRRAGSPA